MPIDNGQEMVTPIISPVESVNVETPVVEMKPVVDEQPVENTEANINMEKLQKLNEALNSFESDLEDK